MALEDPRRRFFGTGQIAQYCAVTTDGVLRWIRDGKLRAFSTPGGHYRVSAEDLRDFLHRYDIPVDESFFAPPVESRTIVAIDADASVERVLRKALAAFEAEVEIVTATGSYEAGLTIGRLLPDLIVLGPKALERDGGRVCRALRGDDVARRIPVLALTSPGSQLPRRDLEQSGADCCLAVPDAIHRVRAALARLLDLQPAERSDRTGNGRTA